MFYRLKILNLDGTYSYSDIAEINSECINPISNMNVYPNPIGLAVTHLNVGFTNNSESIVWVKVLNIQGVELMKFPIDTQMGENALGIDISNLAAGTYFTSLKKSKGKTISKQFVVIKE